MKWSLQCDCRLPRDHMLPWDDCFSTTSDVLYRLEYPVRSNGSQGSITSYTLLAFAWLFSQSSPLRRPQSNAIPSASHYSNSTTVSSGLSSHWPRDPLTALVNGWPDGFAFILSFLAPLWTICQFALSALVEPYLMVTSRFFRFKRPHR